MFPLLLIPREIQDLVFHELSYLDIIMLQRASRFLHRRLRVWIQHRYTLQHFLSLNLPVDFNVQELVFTGPSVSDFLLETGVEGGRTIILVPTGMRVCERFECWINNPPSFLPSIHKIDQDDLLMECTKGMYFMYNRHRVDLFFYDNILGLLLSSQCTFNLFSSFLYLYTI